MAEKIQKLLSGGNAVQRREALKALGALGVGLAVMPIGLRPARAADEAIYFTWGGYDDPAMQVNYEQNFGTLPEFAVYGDSEEGLQKIRAGFVVDVAHPCSGDVPRWREAGVIQPIDTSRLKNWGDLFPELRELPAANHEGKTYMVPWEWGLTSITYRTDLVEVPSGGESWSMLWDEKNKGKISVIDSAEDAWWVAAIYAGVPFDQVDDAAIAKVKDLLQKQRPLLRMHTSDNTVQEQALASGEVVAAMTWGDTANNLTQQGLPVKFAQPKEGTLTWVCGLVIHKDAPQLDKAYELIDGMLEPNVGNYCITGFGYGHSNPKSFDDVDQAQLAAVGISQSPVETLKSGHFYVPQSPDVITKINRDWDEVKAGF